MADLPQLCLSEGKSGPEEAPLVPGTARALSGRRRQQSRNILSFSSSIAEPLHSITSLGKRCTNNEHSLVVEADVYFIYTFLLFLSERNFWENWTGIVPESCLLWPRPWELFTACSLWCRPLTVNSVKLVLCSKRCIAEKAISRGSLTTCHVYTI